MGLKIITAASALPERFVTNAELAGFLDTNDEWIIAKTGIKTRAVRTRESLTDMAEKAALNAIEKSGIMAKELDMIICSTLAGDYITPSLACAVSERLKTTCPAFDINAACTGFIYALDIAAAYLSSNRAKNILIVSADMMSSLVDWNDRASCILFGDAAGACIVTEGNALKYINLTAAGDTKTLRLKSGGGNSPFANENESRGFLELDGPSVYRFAVSSIENEINKTLDALELKPCDIDYFVLHQANKRIIDSARKRLNLPEEKFPMNIDKYGNTSSATIPVLLDEMLGQGKIKEGSKLLLAAFGAGLTTGACVLFWE